MLVPSITVLGSVNLDLVASVDRLPVAGETLTGATINSYPGGKGANQALAAARLGANVSLVACVGDDANADAALALLQKGGVDLSLCRRVDGQATGLALISVAPDGENQIVVAPGANCAHLPEALELPVADALICQLEVPADALVAAAEQFGGFFCINLAPAKKVPDRLLRRADVLIVNETESAFYGEAMQIPGALVVKTLGSKGAIAYRDGVVVADSAAPTVTAVDTTGAGDTFTAALVVSLVTGKSVQESLEFACVAGSLATTKAGAQPALPYLEEVISERARIAAELGAVPEP